MFGKKKPDGIVEAVRYGSDGRLEWVRMHERRGPTYSDHRLVKRQELIDKLKSGQRIVVGERVPFLANTFKTGAPLHLVQKNGSEIVVAGEVQAEQDRLEGVPLI